MRPILCSIPGCQLERIDSQPYCHAHARVETRGRKPALAPRDNRIYLRFTDDEMCRLARAADDMGLDLAGYIRQMLLPVTHPELGVSESRIGAGTESQP